MNFYQRAGEDNSNLKQFEKEESFGYTCIEVLPFLKGQEINEISMSYISSLRPSIVEVIYEPWGYYPTCQDWRVRVFMKDKKIDHIIQEVRVVLYGDIECGWDLQCRLAGKEFPGKGGKDVFLFDNRILQEIPVKIGNL